MPGGKASNWFSPPRQSVVRYYPFTLGNNTVDNASPYYVSHDANIHLVVHRVQGIEAWVVNLSHLSSLLW